VIPLSWGKNSFKHVSVKGGITGIRNAVDVLSRRAEICLDRLGTRKNDQIKSGIRSLARS
jgi:hypothetical protein